MSGRRSRANQRKEIKRQLAELVAARDRARDELAQRLIQADSIDARIDVLLERLLSTAD